MQNITGFLPALSLDRSGDVLSISTLEFTSEMLFLLTTYSPETWSALLVPSSSFPLRLIPMESCSMGIHMLFPQIVLLPQSAPHAGHFCCLGNKVITTNCSELHFTPLRKLPSDMKHNLGPMKTDIKVNI